MAHSFIELLKVVILMLRKIEGRRRGRQRITWLDGFSDSMDTSLIKFQETGRTGKRVYCRPWGRKELDTTEQPNSKSLG